MFCVVVVVLVKETVWIGEVRGLKSWFEVMNFFILTFFAVFEFILFCYTFFLNSYDELLHIAVYVNADFGENLG